MTPVTKLLTVPDTSNEADLRVPLLFGTDAAFTVSSPNPASMVSPVPGSEVKKNAKRRDYRLRWLARLIEGRFTDIDPNGGHVTRGKSPVSTLMTRRHP